ncbi:hypothetical protein V1514DRAFT_274730 [Lipomyces japonicus]|uniref:uncharacterized protein n=1 Tax=Lipomyces japonicus TaxID=56871 RepID=UPI0034CE5F3A
MPPRDSSRSHIHLTTPRSAEFMQEWVSTHLPDEEIIISPEYQPINPEDEDDVVPDQHAAFGILLSQLRRYRPAAYTSALHGGAISSASAAAAAAAIASAAPGSGTAPWSFLNASAWKDLDLHDLASVPQDFQDGDSNVMIAAPFRRITSVAEFFRERREENGLISSTTASAATNTSSSLMSRQNGLLTSPPQLRLHREPGFTDYDDDDDDENEYDNEEYPRHARTPAAAVQDSTPPPRARQMPRAPR